MTEQREITYAKIKHELDHAYSKHGREPWGRHEFYAILLEEVDELWEAIKQDRPQVEVMVELVQVAAMCFRYAETGDRYRIIEVPPRVNDGWRNGERS
jgi:NTP pyrophosphatase (non-canonical NTP hydrolase)